MKLSPQELQSKRLLPETLQFAVKQIEINGYVIFESVIPKEKIDELHKAFIPTFEKFRANHQLNRGVNRTSMVVPFVQPFIDEQILVNPIVMSVTEALLGEDCTCRIIASDTPMPGSEFQEIHSDGAYPFPDYPNSRIPVYSLLVNIPLVDFREDNGPMEVWPGGTHYLNVGNHLGSTRSEMDQLKDYMLSEKVLMPAGSFLIRDTRMWHRGTPNRSNELRPMMAMIYNRHWYFSSSDIRIPSQEYEQMSDRMKQLFRFENIGAKVLEY